MQRSRDPEPGVPMALRPLSDWRQSIAREMAPGALTLCWSDGKRRKDMKTRCVRSHRETTALTILLALMLPVLLCGAFNGWAQGLTAAGNPSTATLAAYPLKLSANRRYLVDQKGKPFRIVGDTPQGLMGRLSE